MTAIWRTVARNAQGRIMMYHIVVMTASWYPTSAYLRAGPCPSRIALTYVLECQRQACEANQVCRDSSFNSDDSCKNARQASYFLAKDSTPCAATMCVETECCKPKVSCGGHVADSCAECPDGNGPACCGGDCQGVSSECIPACRTLPEADCTAACHWDANG